MNLKDTIGKEIAIHCPEEWMANKLMEEYKKLGIKWEDENINKDSRWDAFGEDTYYTTEYSYLEVECMNISCVYGYNCIHFNELEFGDDTMKQFTKSDMIIGKHAFKKRNGKMFIWDNNHQYEFRNNLTVKDDRYDIVEIYELVKIAEINPEKTKEMTQQELIEFAEEKLGTKVKIKGEN